MNIFTSWGDAFTYSLQSIWISFINFVPRFLFAVIVFIIGWIIGAVIGKAIDQVISALKVDKALESAGADSVMNRAGMKLNVGAFIGGIVKWFIIVVFLVASLDILQLTAVTDFLKTDVLGYLPNVIVAALILVVATVVSDFMGKVVMASAKAGNIRSANFLGTLTRYAIWIFAFIIALGQLGIAAAYMQIFFTGLVAMLAIAGGLAFGLGGKEAAAHTIAKLHEHTKPLN
jgi:small-conductance mechanosensitive channel